MSRNTVSRIIKQAQLHDVCSNQLKTLSVNDAKQLLKVHINEPGKPDELYEMPNYDYYSKELKKPGVTITMHRKEYISQYRKSGKVPYQKTQFDKHFRNHIKESEFTDIIRYKPGETIEADQHGTRPFERNSNDTIMLFMMDEKHH